MERAPKESAITSDSTKRLPVSVAAALALAGCGGSGGSGGGSFREYEHASTVEPKALFVIARAHVGERDANQTTQELEAVSDRRAAVTLTFHGLRDDSVRDERHVVTVEYDAEADRWRVVGDAAMYRCHEGRGQQQFGPALCR